MLITGTIFLSFGIALLYWVNRRKFNRRGVNGIEEFKSFENALLIKLMEGLGKWIAYILLILSVLYFWRFLSVKNKDGNEVDNSKKFISTYLITTIKSTYQNPFEDVMHHENGITTKLNIKFLNIY